MEYMAHGNIKAANEHFQRSVDITPKMALNLIDILRREGIEYIVAPYEADAQLTYLSINNLVDAVITEDSDLIPYGCPRIIYKLDKMGNAKEVDLSNIGSSRELDFSSFTLEMFRHMCILSGCDYLPSIPSLGIKTAYNLVKEYRDIDKILEVISNNKKYKMPEHYIANFKKADITFLHQVVYDPVHKRSVPLRPLPDGVSVDDIPFVGKQLSDDIAVGVATGILDPHSHNPFLATDTVRNSVQKPNEGRVTGETLPPYIAPSKVTKSSLTITSSTTQVTGSAKECLRDSVRYTLKKAKTSSFGPGQKNRIFDYFKVKKREPPQVITERDLNPPFMTKKKKIIELEEFKTIHHQEIKGDGSEKQGLMVVKSKYFESKEEITDVEKSASNDSDITCTTERYSQDDDDIIEILEDNSPILLSEISTPISKNESSPSKTISLLAFMKS